MKALIWILIALVVVAAGLTGWYWWSGETDPEGLVEGEQVEQEEARLVSAKHQFSDGTHIVAGEVEMPTPCDLLETDVTVAESTPEQVTIAFTTVNESEVCAQVITPARFKVEFEASENAQISATWNGQPARLNLIPAGENENLEDFEIYIKG